MNEIAFDKYRIKGAYHWVECFGPVHRLNAFTLGRYQVVIDALRAARPGPNCWYWMSAAATPRSAGCWPCN